MRKETALGGSVRARAISLQSIPLVIGTIAAFAALCVGCCATKAAFLFFPKMRVPLLLSAATSFPADTHSNCVRRDRKQSDLLKVN